MSRFFSKLSQIPESPHALPALMGFAALLMGTLFFARLNSDINYDGQTYIAAAILLKLGQYKEAFALYQMPAYPFIIALIQKLLPHWVLAGRLISFLAITLTVIPLYRIGAELFGTRAAFWCCISFILMPEVVNISNSVMREPLFFMFFLFSVFFALKSFNSNNEKYAICAAIYATASTFFRVEGLIFFPLYLIFLFGIAILTKNRLKNFIKNVAFVCVIGAIFACAYLSTVVVLSDESFNRYNLFSVYIRGFITGNFFEEYNRISGQFIRIHDLSAYSGVGHNISDSFRYIFPLMYFFSILHLLASNIFANNLLPLIWGLFHSKFNERRLFVLVFVLGFIMIDYAYFIRTGTMLNRYLMMPGILLCPWIGFGIENILKLVQFYPSNWLKIGCILIMVFLYPALKIDKYFFNQDDIASRTAIWISSEEKLKDKQILFNDQIVKFYAEIEDKNKRAGKFLLYVDSTDNDFSQLLSRAIDNGIDAIVIQEKTDGNNIIRELPPFKFIKELKYKNKKVVRIYMNE